MKELKETGFLLFLLGPHVGPNNELLNGEVENQWSDCGIKYSTWQELVGQVNGEEIRLTGSVESADTELSRLGRIERIVCRLFLQC